MLAAIEGLLAAALRLTLDTWGYQFVDATSKILRIAGPVTGCLGGLLWAVSGRVDRARHRVLAVVTVIVGLLPVLILLGDVVEWPY